MGLSQTIVYKLIASSDMNDHSTNEDLSHTIQQAAGTIAVDIVKYTPSGKEFKQRQYERVDFLNNGWVRCVKPQRNANTKRSVNYYPPQNVREISSVEPPTES